MERRARADSARTMRMAAVVGAAVCLFASAARAGPPYVTDDPEPTETGHFEDYAFVSGTRTPGETEGEAGLDLNYGAAKDLQLTAVVPLDYDYRRAYRLGGGTVELAAKYLILHQSDRGWTPDISLFPAIELPTAARAFGTGRTGFFLPVWMQKDVGKWSTFGGGGYAINPGPGQRNFVLAGWAVTRQVSERLNLGLEIYHQTRVEAGGRAMTNLGFGAVYGLTDHLAVLASGGPGLQSGRGAARSAFYVSLELTY